VWTERGRKRKDREKGKRIGSERGGRGKTSRGRKKSGQREGGRERTLHWEGMPEIILACNVG
jgi:hypothetical protein